MAAESAVRVIFLGDSASAVRSVSRLESSFGGLGRTAKLVTGAIGIAMVGALGAATAAAISFDRSMRNVNSIAKLSEKQFQDLSKRVLALGASTGQTPKVLADGLYDIVSSGFKANDAIKILAVSAKAATAGMTDTATASKAVVAILNAYGLQADKARNVSSLLFKEVQLGVNTFEELATNIGDTAPLAAALKIPFSDVAAGLALITLHGTSMAEASTQMSRVMTDLLKPSDSLTKLLHSMGYENGQAAIQAHGFIPLIKQLSDAAQGSAAKTADWFQNIRSLRGILNLTGPNLAKFNQFADQMALSFQKGGADVAAFNEQAKSISVQWAMAKSALIAAAIPIGQLLFPALIKAAQGVSYLANTINQHMPQIRRITNEVVSAIQRGFTAAQPTLRAFGNAAVQIGRWVQANWPQIRSTALAVGQAIRVGFTLARQVVIALMPVVRALAPVFQAAFSVALGVIRAFAAVSAASMRMTAAEIRIVMAVVKPLGGVFNAAMGAAASAVRAAGAVINGILSGITHAINGVIAALHALGAAKDAAGGLVNPGKGHRVAPGPPGRSPGGGQGLATGGFVAGPTGSPQLILAHAGEVVLNPMQQAALGGAGFFKQMFGFRGEGPGFAAGGIVSKGFTPKRRHSSKSPHHKPRPRVRTTNKAARAALAAVDAVNQREDDADRAYGQLVRQYDISQEQFIRTGPDGVDYISKPDITQRVAEIDALIKARDHMLELLEEERKKLKAAIARLKQAIARMVVAIRAENKAVVELNKQISRESRKKKPNQNLISRWRSQVSAHQDRARTFSSTIGDFRSAIKDEQLNLVHTLPYDRRDVQLDIMTLQAERKDVVGTTLPPSGGAGGGGGGTGDTGGSSATDDLLKLIGQLRLALGIQTAQQGIIGAFAKGTLSVPETGLALVHAGESIRPAGYAGGSDGGSIADVQVKVVVEDGAVDPNKIRVEAIKATDAIMLRMGNSASERSRSGRF